MPFIESFNAGDFLATLVSLLAAFGLGTLIGAERQYRQRTAGLRTNVLVAIGACQFVDMAMHLAGPDGAVRVVAYVVSGIGFLGAGVIMKEGANIRGLNTAATLWCSAAVGACAGADLIAQAVLLTAFVLAGNTMLRPLVSALERIPRSEESTEATYGVNVVTRADPAELQGKLSALLDKAQFPVDVIEPTERADGSAELRATLVNTSVRISELDAVVARIRHLPEVVSATWTRSAAD
ncbi:MgtC/SapB family protein [Ancylobacter amanitiformis]|uniref:Protein MgtC n=1 Tax=Ancylobacter amanitiformis TaxID=217069 RepID=A0ABU0LUA9_9HYPH|nr:MgtC/SapB family protein [Ancylobacter amanitiformis]MDQ0512291.1 putative Mg2+ transporter-C (MgtC) family protein [Ancylobacter amanitiformis]